MPDLRPAPPQTARAARGVGAGAGAGASERIAPVLRDTGRPERGASVPVRKGCCAGPLQSAGPRMSCQCFRGGERGSVLGSAETRLRAQMTSCPWAVAWAAVPLADAQLPACLSACLSACRALAERHARMRSAGLRAPGSRRPARGRGLPAARWHTRARVWSGIASASCMQATEAGGLPTHVRSNIGGQESSRVGAGCPTLGRGLPVRVRSPEAVSSVRNMRRDR